MSRFFAALGGEGGFASPQEERAERLRIEATLYELERIEPWGSVSGEALDALKERYRRRLAYLALAPGERKMHAEELVTPPESPGARQVIAPPPAAGELTPSPPAAESSEPPAPLARPASPAPGPGLREFLAERSILIVSYVGAFLLIVATLLFELAAETFGGPVRFAGVLALDLVFGAAAWVCWRSPRLRIVGTTYLAIFALIAPLVFVAAYVFLVLREQGVGVSLAVAVGALSCAALYGLLAVRLRSAGYAALSALALVTGWCGGVVAAGLGEWGGAAVTPLPVLFSLFAFGVPAAGGATAPRPSARRRLGLPATFGELFIHGTAALALLWTTLATMEGLFRSSPNAADSWAMTVTLAGLAVVYAAYGWLSSRWQVAPLVALCTTLTALAGTLALDADERAPSLLLLTLAATYAALTVWLPGGAGARTRQALRGLAALQAAVCVLAPVSPDWLQLVIVLAVAALGCFLAWSGSRVTVAGERDAARWWLLYAGVAASVAWFWLVKLVVPPPERPTFLGLLTAYAPLPVLFAVAGVVVSRTLGRAWAVPVYAVAAANAAWVGTSLLFQRDFFISGWTYAAYAVTVYAVCSRERLPGGPTVATTLLLGAAAALLTAYEQPQEWWPLVLAVVPWLTYAGARFWAARRGQPAWMEEHRLSALLLSGTVAGGCFAVLRYYREGNAGALTSLVALLSCAALVGVDALRREAPYQRAGALAIASLGSFWIARYAGLENPQWYVALPALALLWDGYALRRRDRQAARALSGVGLALVLGTTAVQLADGGTDDGLSTATLVVESVAALLVGVALRQRVYVLAGAAGVAVAALRALLMLLSQIPLFAVFGVAALLLLGLAALLAFLRERLGRAVTGTAASTWADWD